jgi:hypothetical protein
MILYDGEVKMRIIVIIILMLSCSLPALAECLNYEPVVVDLTGTIRRQTFPGRPNYESIKQGDEPETFWVLYMENSICINSSGDWNEAETGVKEIQLVLNKENQYEEYRPLLNKKVNVRGILFHSVSGHHHTNVLMKVSTIY